MKETASIIITLPPRLTMDEYLDFIESSRTAPSPALTDRQKQIEKQILKPFQLPPLVS